MRLRMRVLKKGPLLGLVFCRMCSLSSGRIGTFIIAFLHSSSVLIDPFLNPGSLSVTPKC